MIVNREKRRAFGPLIQSARVAKGLTQTDLEDMTGISRRTIGSIERGATVAQHDVLQRLLQVLDLVPVETDPDVQAFTAMIEPLLQQVDPELRPELMKELVTLTASRLRGRVVELHPRSTSITGMSEGAPTVDDVDERAVASTETQLEGPGEFNT